MDKKRIIYHIIGFTVFFFIGFILSGCLSYFNIISITTHNIVDFILFSVMTILNILFIKNIYKKSIAEREEEYQKINDEHQISVKNIYDEHIFAITHELRSPLSVIAASANEELNNIKEIYNSLFEYLQNRDDFGLLKDQFSLTKRSIKTTQEQVKNIEEFIRNISEHGSYVTTKGDGIKALNLHTYLTSIIINAPSFSRSMKIFNGNIKFGDIYGKDFDKINVVCNPHDLTRILMNLMNNAADAVSSSYHFKKQNDPRYEPVLKIRCIKSLKYNTLIKLNKNYSRINNNPIYPHQSFYIIIEDNGPGISKENLNKIFQYGFSTKDKKDHYGFGLQLTLKLIEKNDLTLYLYTNDNGTRMVIGFPQMFCEIKDDSSMTSADSMVLYKESVEYEIIKKEKD